MDAFDNNELDCALLAVSLDVESIYSVLPAEDVPWLSAHYEFEFLSNYSLLAISILTHYYICDEVSSYTGEDYTTDFFAIQNSCRDAFDSYQKAKRTLEARRAPERYDVVDIPDEILGFLHRHRSYEEMMDAVDDLIVRVQSAVAGRDSEEGALEFLQRSPEKSSEFLERTGPRFAWQIYKLRIDGLIWQELHSSLSRSEFDTLHMNLLMDDRCDKSEDVPLETRRRISLDQFMDYFLYRVLGITKGRGFLKKKDSSDEF